MSVSLLVQKPVVSSSTFYLSSLVGSWSSAGLPAAYLPMGRPFVLRLPCRVDSRNYDEALLVVSVCTVSGSKPNGMDTVMDIGCGSSGVVAFPFLHGASQGASQNRT